EPRLRDSKLIAREALALCSPPDIKRIPLSNQPTWKNSEPLLNLPSKVVDEMISIVGREDILSQVVDDSVIIGNYVAFLKARNSTQGRPDLMSNLKQFMKKVLPKPMVAAYQEASRHHLKTPPYMLFKRYFAMKVFIDSIS